jgi:hypothetical protein
MADKLWVEKDGKRELHTAINARDLLNNAGWVVSDDQSDTGTVPEPAPAPVVEDDDDETGNDTEIVADETAADAGDSTGNDTGNQDDTTNAADDGVTDKDTFGNTVVYTPLDGDETTPAPAPVVSSDETPQPAPPPPDGGTIPVTEPPLNDDKSPIDIIEKTQRDIQSLNKVELEAYARKEFGFEVDRRHSESKIKAQILGLAEAKRVSPTGL